MSASNDGKLFKRDPYIKGEKKKPKTDKKLDPVELYVIQHKEFITIYGKPLYWHDSEYCWTSNVDKATRTAKEEQLYNEFIENPKIVFVRVER